MKILRDLKIFFDWKIVVIKPVLILLKFELVVRTNLEKERDFAGSVWVNSQSIKISKFLKDFQYASQVGFSIL